MSKLNISTHISKLIEALILFVVISGGVIAGLYVASKAELTPFGHGNGLTVERLQNRTTLEVGSEFPSAAIVDAQDRPVDLKSVLKHKKTIIGFRMRCFA